MFINSKKLIFRNIYQDEFFKISHEYVFQYGSMKYHSQSLTLKFINSILEEHMKTKRLLNYHFSLYQLKLI